MEGTGISGKHQGKLSDNSTVEQTLFLGCHWAQAGITGPVTQLPYKGRLQGLGKDKSEATLEKFIKLCAAWEMWIERKCFLSLF